MTDLEMIQSPMEWPKWPFLPLKHRTRALFHDPKGMGLLLAVETPPFVVYHANMFAVALSGAKSLGEAVQSYTTETYNSAADCAAEWRVD